MLYEATSRFPASERYGITSQMRRACSSIPANLAEGAGRGSDAEFARFCTIALGSATELDYFLLLARDLGYMPSGSYEQLTADVQEVSRMLAGLIRKVKGKK